MSMELYIFSDRRLSSIAEWQQAIDAEGFALRLSDEGSFDEVSGFLPMHLDGRPTGVECDHDDPEELLEQLREALPDIDWSHPWQHVLSFRWLGSHVDESIAAFMAAAAYARASGGVVFDCEAGVLIGPDDAKANAAGLEDWWSRRNATAPENEHGESRG